MSVKLCPSCGEESITTRRVKDRKLQDYCDEDFCGWTGDARTPPKKKVVSTREVDAGWTPGFQYEIFDKYGYILTSSESKRSMEEARAAARKELEAIKDLHYGPGTAVVWPSTVKVTGEVIK